MDTLSHSLLKPFPRIIITYYNNHTILQSIGYVIDNVTCMTIAAFAIINNPHTYAGFSVVCYRGMNGS